MAQSKARAARSVSSALTPGKDQSQVRSVDAQGPRAIPDFGLPNFCRRKCRTCRARLAGIALLSALFASGPLIFNLLEYALERQA